MMNPYIPVIEIGEAKGWLLAAISPGWLNANPVQWSVDRNLPRPQPQDPPAAAAAKRAARGASGVTARRSIRALAAEVVLLTINPFLGQPDEALRWQRAREAAELILDEVST